MKPPSVIAGKTVRTGEGSESVKHEEMPFGGPASDDSDLTTQSPDGDEQGPARVNDDGNNTTSTPRTHRKRKKVWSKLLNQFPTGGDDGSRKEWLAKVLLVSDKSLKRKDLRADIQPKQDTKEMAALYLEKAKKPRTKKQRIVEV